jgi:hypothetical protein
MVMSVKVRLAIYFASVSYCENGDVHELVLGAYPSPSQQKG